MKTILSIAAAVLLLGLAAGGTARAETIGYGQAIRALTSACGGDIEAHCKGVRPGDRAIVSCVKNNNPSPNCAATIDITFELLAARAAAQAAAPEICRNDARRHCSNFREGQGRILRCLIRPDIYRGVSQRCRAALTDAGWN